MKEVLSIASFDDLVTRAGMPVVEFFEMAGRRLPEHRRRRLGAKRGADEALERRAAALKAAKAAGRVVKSRQVAGLSMAQVDAMTGVQFEEFLRWVLHDDGVDIELTPATGDRGADLLVTRNRVRQVVQAKRRSLAAGVGPDAVREAIAARTHYRANKALVITNAAFTKQAMETARENDVELWDRETLAAQLATAQERKNERAKDDPALVRARQKIAPYLRDLYALRDGLREKPQRRTATTDLDRIVGVLGSLDASAGALVMKLRMMNAAVRVLLTSFAADNARQAYRLLVGESDVERRGRDLLTTARKAAADLDRVADSVATTKYSAAERATELRSAAVAAIRALVDQVESAGLDREGALVLVRRELAIQTAETEAQRQIDIGEERAKKISEIAAKARQTSRNQELHDLEKELHDLEHRSRGGWR